MSKTYGWELTSGGGGEPVLPAFAPCTAEIYNSTYRDTYGKVGSYFRVDNPDGINQYRCRVVRMHMEQGGLQASEPLYYSNYALMLQATVVSADYDTPNDYLKAGFGMFAMPEDCEGWIFCIIVG